MSSPEYMKQWRQKNQERIKAYNQDHKEKLQEYAKKPERKAKHAISNKRWHKDNQDKMKQWSRMPERRYIVAQTTAKRRNLEFSLSFEEFKTAILEPCYLCHNVLGQPSQTACGLDRLDNCKGYVSGNVKSCCITCNRLKLDCFTPEEARIMVQALLNYRSKNK